MRAVGIALLAVLGVLVLCVVIFISSLMGINNQCASFEQTIIAQYKQNQNSYDNYFKKVKEVAQVPDMYTASFKSVYDGMMKGRYGAEGSKAVFQWIQENNPSFDSSVFKEIQEVIVAGREDFEANQKTLLDKKQVYQSMLNSMPDGFFAKIVGYPKIDLSKYDIVTSDETEKVFATKKSEPLQIK